MPKMPTEDVRKAGHQLRVLIGYLTTTGHMDPPDGALDTLLDTSDLQLAEIGRLILAAVACCGGSIHETAAMAARVTRELEGGGEHNGPVH